MLNYLERLTARLVSGISLLPDEIRGRHQFYLLDMQNDDGGFGGREGGSDLYYTGFGLRSLALLGVLEGATAERAGDFLRRRMAGRESIVDFFSLIYSAALLRGMADIDVFENAPADWRRAVAGALEELRRDDGGYAKGREGQASSTYHTFLVALCFELLELPIPDPERLVTFLRSQWAAGGGFLEIRAGKRAGTNPTAAAIGTLTILEHMDDAIRDETVDFLVDMQTEEGGLRANTRIPIADILSTFTGLVTLWDLDAIAELDLRAVRGYVYSLQRTEGGFHAAIWDDAHDVEYTFYGLGSLALLILREHLEQEN
jgi:geranylgeranyl transferase type-2 subunit beta